jgi:phage tail P2-like protein
MQNEVTQYLSACYRQGDEQEEIAIALTQGIADKYSQLQQILDTYEQDYLDPSSCKEDWLDVIAYWSGWGELWNSTWSSAIKRSLLKETEKIWSNRGNRDVLVILFSIFGLTVDLVPQTGFILNVTTFPGGLGVDPFAYVVKLPNTYTDGSPEFQTVKRLLKDFLPCWIEFSYSYV